MFGIIGQMLCASGTREEVIAILSENTHGMEGCHLYHIARDLNDADAIWITESWDSRAAHEASLKLPQVQDAIRRARPMIAGFGQRFETEPVG